MVLVHTTQQQRGPGEKYIKLMEGQYKYTNYNTLYRFTFVLNQIKSLISYISIFFPKFSIKFYLFIFIQFNELYAPMCVCVCVCVWLMAMDGLDTKKDYCLPLPVYVLEHAETTILSGANLTIIV